MPASAMGCGEGPIPSASLNTRARPKTTPRRSRPTPRRSSGGWSLPRLSFSTDRRDRSQPTLGRRWFWGRYASLAAGGCGRGYSGAVCAKRIINPHCVAPADAGAYPAYRFRLTGVMGPSLRWGDGGFGAGAALAVDGGCFRMARTKTSRA